MAEQAVKLLFCTTCNDVFKLTYSMRQCECGLVKGRYNEDGHTSVSNGEGRSLAIGNGSLMNALMGLSQFKYKDNTTFLAWVRSNSREENPRSTVDPDL